MDHILHRCDEEDCPVCNGGLALCVICGGAEASLPTDCPERKMTSDEQEAVQAGRINYLHGEWVAEE